MTLTLDQLTIEILDSTNEFEIRFDYETKFSSLPNFLNTKGDRFIPVMGYRITPELGLARKKLLDEGNYPFSIDACIPGYYVEYKNTSNSVLAHSLY